jgi:hypothetical protein
MKNDTRIMQWPFSKWYFWLIVGLWYAGSELSIPYVANGEYMLSLLTFCLIIVFTYIPFVLFRAVYVVAYLKGHTEGKPKNKKGKNLKD